MTGRTNRAMAKLAAAAALLACAAVRGGSLPFPAERIRTHADYPGVRIVKDIPYGSRGDLPGEGAEYEFGGRRTDFLGEPCSGHRTGQFLDLYLPGRIDAGRPAFLYIHGGGFCQPYDKNTQGQFFAALAQRGWVVASANYVLQNDFTANPPRPLRENATLRDMLRDVDACVSFLKGFLPSVGAPSDRIAIGGESAGGCVSSLYAYDQAAPELLGLGLRHELPVAFELNIAGATDLDDPALRAAIGKGDVGGMLDVALMGEDAGRAERRVRYMAHNLVRGGSAPTIAAYSVLTNAVPPGDGCIGIATYDRLTNALASAGVRYSGAVFENMWHCEMIVPGTREREAAREWIFAQMERMARETAAGGRAGLSERRTAR